MNNNLLPFSEQPEEDFIQQNKKNIGESESPSFIDLSTQQFKNQAFDSVGNLVLEATLPKEEIISPETLNNKYGLNLFTVGTTPRSASFIYQKFLQDQKLESMYQLAKAGPVKRFATQMAGGLPAFALDPINLGLLVASDGAMNSFYNASSGIRSLTEIMGKETSINLVQDLTQSVAEFGIRKGMQDYTQTEPDLVEGLAMAVAGNAFMHGMGKAFHGLSGLNPKTAKQAVDRTHTPHSINEKVITTELWNDVMDSPNKKFYKNIDPNESVFAKASQEIDHVNFESGAYAALTEDKAKIQGRNIHAGPRFGEGLVLHNNPNFPTKLAEHFNANASLYNFAEVGLKQEHLLDAHSYGASVIAGGDLHPLLVEAEKRFGKKFKDVNTLADLFTKLEKDIPVAKAKELDMFFKYANNKMEAMGYQGYSYNLEGNSKMYKIFNKTAKALEDSMGDLQPLDLRAKHQDFGIEVDPNLSNDPQVNFLHQGGMDLNVPMIQEAMGLHTPKRYDLVPSLMNKRMQMQTPQGFLTDGKRIKMDVHGRVFVSDLLAHDTEFQMGYTEIFSKEHIDRVKVLLEKNKPKQITKEFPDIKEAGIQRLKDVKNYEMFDAQAIAHENATKFFDSTDWHTKSIAEIKRNLSTLDIKGAKAGEKFLTEKADLLELKQQQLHLTEEMHQKIVEADNLMARSQAKDVLTEAEKKRISENKNAKDMYRMLKQEASKSASLEQGLAKKMLPDFEKTMAKSDAIEKQILDKGKAIGDIIQASGIDKASQHAENLIKPLEELTAELKRRNPDMIETIIKATEVCLRRNP